MKTLLLILTSVTALTAIISGAMLLAVPDGGSLYLPITILIETPFKNFIIPGLVLLLVVGGISIIASFSIVRRHKKAYSFSQAAGLILSGWIIAQMMITSVNSWIQWVFLFIGISILLISTQLKGKTLF